MAENYNERWGGSGERWGEGWACPCWVLGGLEGQAKELGLTQPGTLGAPRGSRQRHDLIWRVWRALRGHVEEGAG